MSAQINITFLSAIDANTKAAILGNIAHHYGISLSEALEELMGDDAEHLLEYVTGATRLATSVLMQRQGILAAAAK